MKTVVFIGSMGTAKKSNSSLIFETTVGSTFFFNSINRYNKVDMI